MLEQTTIESIIIVAKFVEGEIKKKLLEQDHVASAKLLQSIDSEIDKVSGSILGYAEDYAKYIDGGRRPKQGFPPLWAIERWIEQKGFVFDGKIKSVAFLIARKISNFGTQRVRNGVKLTGYLTDTLNEQEQYITDRLFQIFGLDINVKMENIIEQNRIEYLKN